MTDFEDTIAVTLRLPGDKLAHFTVSHSADGIDSLIIAGTNGSIHMSPCYEFHNGLEQNRQVCSEKRQEAIQAIDHFGGEPRFFSNCVLNDADGEWDGEEGSADLVVIEAIVEALKSGKSFGTRAC